MKILLVLFWIIILTTTVFAISARSESFTLVQAELTEVGSIGRVRDLNAKWFAPELAFNQAQSESFKADIAISIFKEPQPEFVPRPENLVAEVTLVKPGVQIFFIAGIIVLIIVFCLILFFFFKRRKKEPKEKSPEKLNQ